MTEVITFGCRLNAYESEIIKQKAKTAGIEGEVFILNTCSVTQEAEREAVKQIRKLKKENPLAKIIVTGCAAQVNSAKFAGMEEVSLVFGNKEKLEDATYKTVKEDGLFLGEKATEKGTSRHEDKIFFNERKELQDLSQKVLVNDIFSVTETGHMYQENDVVKEFEHHTRAFVQIQNGCNHRCTFCIIPFARGNSRSVPFGKLAEEVSALVENGYKEIVLTGVDITDYGKDLPGELTLGKMAKRLLKHVPSLPRLRFSSIDVAEVDRDIYDLISNEPRFMPYFHISLQSGDDLILKRMKRRHTRAQALEFIKQVRYLRPEVAFGADVIAGFPTETEENFLNSKNLITEGEIAFCHIFSFSPHKGTPASKMPQVERGLIKARTGQLIAEGKLQLNKLLNGMVGKEYNVLIETNNMGRCENFASGVFEGAHLERGQIVKAKAVGLAGEKLLLKAL